MEYAQKDKYYNQKGGQGRGYYGGYKKVTTIYLFIV